MLSEGFSSERSEESLYWAKIWLPNIKKQAPKPDKIFEFISDFDNFISALIQQRYAEEREILQTEAERIRIEKAKRKKTKKEHEEALMAGTKPIKNIDDAKIVYRSKDGEPIIEKPPVIADGKTYHISGKLYKKDGAGFVFEFTSGFDTKYFFGEFNNISYKNLRFEDYYKLIGKFRDVLEYTTVSGIVGYAPVFEVLYIE